MSKFHRTKHVNLKNSYKKATDYETISLVLTRNLFASLKKFDDDLIEKLLNLVCEPKSILLIVLYIKYIRNNYN